MCFDKECVVNVHFRAEVELSLPQRMDARLKSASVFLKINLFLLI